MEVSLSYQPVTHEVADTAASVDIERIRYAARLGVCWVHPDVKLRRRKLFGKKNWQQECHRCREIHEVSIVGKRINAAATPDVQSGAETKESADAPTQQNLSTEGPLPLRLQQIELKDCPDTQQGDHLCASPVVEPVSPQTTCSGSFDDSRSTIGSERQTKILLKGDSGVGKSNLLERAAKGTFTSCLASTVGVDFQIFSIRTGENEDVHIRLWDTPGQERLTHAISRHYRGVDSVILCYDISRRETFSRLGEWTSEISRYAPAHVNVILAGFKADLEESREVTYEEGNNWAVRQGMLFFECSSKEDFNVLSLIHAAYRQSSRIERFLSVGGQQISRDSEYLQQHIVVCNAPECVETMTSHNSLMLQWSVGAETSVLVRGKLQFELDFSVGGGLYTMFWSRAYTDRQRYELLQLPSSTRVVARVRGRVSGQRKWGAWSDYSFDMYNHSKKGWDAWVARERSRSTSEAETCTRQLAANVAKYFPDTLVGAVVDIPGRHIGKVLQYNRSWWDDRSTETFTIDFVDSGVEKISLTTHGLRTFWKWPRKPFHVVELPSDPNSANDVDDGLIILLLGDSGTGKTTMFQTFLGEQSKATTSTLQVLPRSFCQERKTTYATSADLELGPVKGSVMDAPGDHRLTQLLLDPSGSMRDRLRRVTALVLVYSVNSQTSFTNIFTHWWTIKQGIEALNGSTLPTIVVGNKTDLRTTHNRDTCVRPRDGPERCRKLDIPHVETSATARPETVLEAFDLLIKLQQENPPVVAQADTEMRETAVGR